MQFLKVYDIDKRLSPLNEDKFKYFNDSQFSKVLSIILTFEESKLLKFISINLAQLKKADFKLFI
jgi:hypothetical protein